MLPEIREKSRNDSSEKLITYAGISVCAIIGLSIAGVEAIARRIKQAGNSLIARIAEADDEHDRKWAYASSFDEETR